VDGYDTTLTIGILVKYIDGKQQDITTTTSSTQAPIESGTFRRRLNIPLSKVDMDTTEFAVGMSELNEDLAKQSRNSEEKTVSINFEIEQASEALVGISAEILTRRSTLGKSVIGIIVVGAIFLTFSLMKEKTTNEYTPLMEI